MMVSVQNLPSPPTTGVMLIGQPPFCRSKQGVRSPEHGVGVGVGVGVLVDVGVSVGVLVAVGVGVLVGIGVLM